MLPLTQRLSDPLKAGLLHDSGRGVTLLDLSSPRFANMCTLQKMPEHLVRAPYEEELWCTFRSLLEVRS